MDTYEQAVAQGLSQLQLEKLDSTWVNEIIENDFLQSEDIPLSYQDVLEECGINILLQNLQEHVFEWLNLNKILTDEEQEEGVPSLVSRQSIGSSQISENTSAAALNQPASKGSHFLSFLIQEKKVNILNLLALLGFWIDKGSTLASSNQDKQLGFNAGRLYLTMICIPGSMAFRVYHQMLFMKTVQLIQLYIQASKHQKTNVPVNSKKSHQTQASQPTLEVEEEEEESPLSSDDITFIEKEIPSFMDALTLVAQHLSLRRYPNILKETIESILPIVSLNKGRVSVKALEIVQNFCQPLHGDAVQTVHHVFVHILPYLALDPNEKDLNNRNVIALKDISFNLVESFILKFGESIYPFVQGLIKHVCVEVIDRAEYRQRTAQTSLDLLQLMPVEHQQATIRWFLLLAHAEQASLRLFSMEILSLLLHSGRIDRVTFAVIFSQCSDPSATVRAKALSILSDCIESKDHSIVEMVNFIFAENSENQTHQERESDHQEIDLLGLLQEEEPLNDSQSLLPKAHQIMNLLKERAMDEKVHVRKNALQLLLSVAQRHSRYLNQDLLRLFGTSCRDVALLIRRHMAQMLTELVHEHPENTSVQKMWVQSVLPLVLDGETRVQEKALECVDLLILRTVIESNNKLGWELIDAIIEQGFDTYLSKAFEMWSREKRIPAQLLRVLLSEAEERPRASLTLIAIAARHNKVDNHVKEYAMEYLEKNLGSTDQATIFCIQQVYKVIGASLPNMSKENLRTICALSGRFVANFQLPTNLITTACDVVIFCIQHDKDENDARREAGLWATEILHSCGEYLSCHLRKPDIVSLEEEEQLARRICTLGSVALHCPQEINKRHFLLLQHAAFQPESGVDAPIPFSQPQSQPTRQLPPRLQAASIISLGKLSIQHEEMAKQLIPGLGRLLETTPHEAIRNNIVCILCDWVVRYSTAVDPVIPQVTACLRDPNPIVRKQTLVLLIHLLQEDYLKIRGTFFFRILQLTCDDDGGLRDLALFYITQRLLHRQPTIIKQHFIESIFHFNDYKGHPTYNKFALTDRESKLFSIAGPQNARRRFQIYQFMLQNLDDEARFQLTFRLTRDVLNGVVEDVMPIKNAFTEAVLKDTLAVLSSDDIKLASLSAQTDDDPAEKEDIAQAIVQSTKKAIIAQVVKRNVIENIVPIVVALKRKLTTNKSPLMGNFMLFLRELMKDYKDEIQEVLAQDRQLMAEIDFDMKRFEQQEKLDTTTKSVSRTDRSVPPSEMLNPIGNLDVQARTNDQLGQSFEFQASEANLPQHMITEADPAVVIDPGNLQAMRSEEQEEDQNPVTNVNANVDQLLLPNDEKVGPNQQNEKSSIPELESSAAVAARKPMAPPKRSVNKTRLLRPRIMSTPIRNIQNDDISFRDGDLSMIPQLNPEPKRRRRN